MPKRPEENSERNEDLATAILNKKARPNRLIVEESVNDDNSVTVKVCFVRAQLDDGIKLDASRLLLVYLMSTLGLVSLKKFQLKLLFCLMLSVFICYSSHVTIFNQSECLNFSVLSIKAENFV